MPLAHRSRECIILEGSANKQAPLFLYPGSPMKALGISKQAPSMGSIVHLHGLALHLSFTYIVIAVLSVQCPPVNLFRRQICLAFGAKQYFHFAII